MARGPAVPWTLQRRAVAQGAQPGRLACGAAGSGVPVDPGGRHFRAGLEEAAPKEARRRFCGHLAACPFPSEPEQVRPGRAQGPGSLSRPSQRPPRATGVVPPLAAAAEAGPVTFCSPAQRRHVEPGYPVPRVPAAQRELAVGVQKGTALAGRRSHRRRRPSPVPKSLVGGCGAISQGLRDCGPGLAWPVPRAPGPGSRRGEGRTREERS